MPFTPNARSGILHHYSEKLVAFEHLPSLYKETQAAKPQLPQKTILFLGGLGDGLATVTYAALLSTIAPPTWSIIEVLLSSSYTGWTTSSLAQDADELSSAMIYFRSVLKSRSSSSTSADIADQTKIIVLGHSTGSQIIAEYLVGPRNAPTVPQLTLSRPKINGFILQAGISDREAIVPALGQEAYDSSVTIAQQYISAGKGEGALPIGTTHGIFDVEPTARRWASLASPEKNGEDDYFSSDLDDAVVERIWGQHGFAGRKVKMCVLVGGADEYIPEHVDRAKLLDRWKQAVVRGDGNWSEVSGVVAGASHNLELSDEDVRRDFCLRILRFAESVDKDDLSST